MKQKIREVGSVVESIWDGGIRGLREAATVGIVTLATLGGYQGTNWVLNQPTSQEIGATIESKGHNYLERGLAKIGVPSEKVDGHSDVAWATFGGLATGLMG